MSEKSAINYHNRLNKFDQILMVAFADRHLNEILNLTCAFSSFWTVTSGPIEKKPPARFFLSVIEEIKIHIINYVL